MKSDSFERLRVIEGFTALPESDLADIAAARQALLDRGAKMSKLMVGGGLVRCEGEDPDGNPFSISDRQ